MQSARRATGFVSRRCRVTGSPSTRSRPPSQPVSVLPHLGQPGDRSILGHAGWPFACDRVDRFCIRAIDGTARRRIVECRRLRWIWDQIAIGPNVRPVVQPVAEEHACFRPSHLDRRHRCQFRAVGGGKSSGGFVCHHLTHVMFQLVFEAINALATPTAAAGSAATPSLLGGTIRLVFASRSMRLTRFTRSIVL